MGTVTDKFPDISFIKDTKVEELLSRMINDYQDKYKEITGKEISLAKADPYRLIIYACALQIYQAMQYADRAGKMSFLKYAKGEYLDNLCALKGIHRIESKPAVTTLEFSIKQPLESAVSIPAGTRATNGNDLFFATDKYVQIEAGETSASVNATCTTAGTCGNGFEDGEINVMVNSLPCITGHYNEPDDTPSEEPEEEAESETEDVAHTTVEPGEGFWQVAERALGDGTRYLELAEFNDMDINTPLYTGMELKLPN